jgi:CDP-glycerol glycerophosphotransferase (TagB/SpsB family)
MILSGIILKAPYWIAWQACRLLRRQPDLVFYVDSLLDYQVMQNILPHLGRPSRIVARNGHVAAELRNLGLKPLRWPVFPKVVVMARHALHRFPIRRVKKIGLMHGPYFFKELIRAERYNAFDRYLFSSPAALEVARSRGILSGVVGGYPRIDSFREPGLEDRGRELFERAGFDPRKKTLMLTGTWDRSHQSAVHKWIGRTGLLQEKFNLLASIHPMMSREVKEKIRAIPGLVIAGQQDLYAWMTVTDYLVSDTSSIMAEFCVLDRPIITLMVDSGDRLTPAIRSMIADISVQIGSLDGLDDALAQYVREPRLKQEARRRWTKVIFGDLSRSHGHLAAEAISQCLERAGCSGTQRDKAAPS